MPAQALMTTTTAHGGPHFDPFRAIERAELQPSTRRQYSRAIERYLAKGGHLDDAKALGCYADTLPASGRVFLKAALKLCLDKDLTAIKGMATSENVKAVQAAIYRAEALTESIKVKQSKGTRAHTWLSGAEVKKLMALPGRDIVGERDRVLLGLLVGAGLRREELVSLAFDDIKPQGERMVVEVKHGKGDKPRVVPISPALARLIDAWGERIGRQGRIVRSLGMARELGKSMTGAAVAGVVKRYGAKLGKPGLAPHDLRRTFAQLGLDAGVPIQQISVVLGHANIATTQRYLNLALDLSSTVSDFVPIE